MRAVGLLNHRLLIDGLIKARPTSARIELCSGAEQFLSANRAVINARSMLIPVFPAERPLRAGLPRDLILLRRQFRAHLGIAEHLPMTGPAGGAGIIDIACPRL